MMPHIAITMLPGRSKETKELLAECIRKLLSNELYVNQDLISVSIEDVSLEDWKKTMTKIAPETLYIKSKTA